MKVECTWQAIYNPITDSQLKNDRQKHSQDNQGNCLIRLYSMFSNTVSRPVLPWILLMSLHGAGLLKSWELSFGLESVWQCNRFLLLMIPVLAHCWQWKACENTTVNANAAPRSSWVTDVSVPQRHSRAPPPLLLPSGPSPAEVTLSFSQGGGGGVCFVYSTLALQICLSNTTVQSYELS